MKITYYFWGWAGPPIAYRRRQVVLCSKCKNTEHWTCVWFRARCQRKGIEHETTPNAGVFHARSVRKGKEHENTRRRWFSCLNVLPLSSLLAKIDPPRVGLNLDNKVLLRP